MNTTQVFVYGSLMRGFGNHGTMQRAGGVFVREDVTLPEFTFYSLGAFPAMAEGGNTAVRGEVYEVPLRGVSVLDSLESEGSLYHRVPVVLASGEVAQTYIMIMDDQDWLGGSRTVLESGDWHDAPRVRTFPYKSNGKIDWHAMYGEADLSEAGDETAVMVVEPDTDVQDYAEWWEEIDHDDREVEAPEVMEAEAARNLSGMTDAEQAEFDAYFAARDADHS